MIALSYFAFAFAGYHLHFGFVFLALTFSVASFSLWPSMCFVAGYFCKLIIKGEDAYD